MKIKAYTVVSRAVEEGIAYGIGRVFKYLEEGTISENDLRNRADVLEDAVLSSLCEVIEFTDEDLGVDSDQEPS